MLFGAVCTSWILVLKCPTTVFYSENIGAIMVLVIMTLMTNYLYDRFIDRLIYRSTESLTDSGPNFSYDPDASTRRRYEPGTNEVELTSGRSMKRIVDTRSISIIDNSIDIERRRRRCALLSFAINSSAFRAGTGPESRDFHYISGVTSLA